MDDIFTWIRIVEAAGSVSVIAYLLTHANDPRSLLGDWRYRRDLREYYYLGIESDMEPAEAREWAREQVAAQWRRPDTDPQPDRRPRLPGRGRGPSP